MAERWSYIPLFPNYEASDRGTIRNSRSGRLLVPSHNQQGILKVNLTGDWGRCTRSVHLLVAQALLPPPTRFDFDSAIHLDGNRDNCYISNLVWRPRHFAVRFYSQMESSNYRNARAVVIDTDTGRQYKTIRDVVHTHGLLVSDVMSSMVRDTRVWPTNQRFRWKS